MTDELVDERTNLTDETPGRSASSGFVRGLVLRLTLDLHFNMHTL